jgi:glutaredoxin 3
VVIYSTRLCGYCTRAKMWFDNKGVAYREVMVDSDPALRDEMVERSRRTSVPQIFIGDRHIGGFQDLVQRDRDGELDGLLGLE